VVDPVNDVDRDISRRIAALPPSRLDTVMKGLTTAANHSLLWFAVATGLALRRGATRKAAARGVLAIALASGSANAVCKPLLPRRRPAAAELPAYQTLASPPTSSSFPSGTRRRPRRSRPPWGSRARGSGWRWPRSPPPSATRGCTSACTGPPTSPQAPRWASASLRSPGAGGRCAAPTRRGPVPVDSVPALPDGEGLLMMVNQFSGDPTYDPVADIARVLPRAEILTVQRGRGIDVQLEAALARRGEEIGSRIKALGVTGGDGSVGAGAAVAERYGLPLVVVPLGTLNHFARDVGVYDLQEVDDATRAGQAVAVDLGVVEVHPRTGSDDEVVRIRTFLNTASIGSYPELVRLREHWQPRWGKWPAFAAALMVVLRRAQAGARAVPRRVAHGVVPVRRQRPVPPPRAWCRRGGRRWTRGCSTCGGCAPTSGSPGCG
jgi:undecaprenyl-diphosphatase